MAMIHKTRGEYLPIPVRQSQLFFITSCAHAHACQALVLETVCNIPKHTGQNDHLLSLSLCLKKKKWVGGRVVNRFFDGFLLQFVVFVKHLWHVCVLVFDVIPHVFDRLCYPFKPRSPYSSVGGVHGLMAWSGSGANVTCLTASLQFILWILANLFILLLR